MFSLLDAHFLLPESNRDHFCPSLRIGTVSCGKKTCVRHKLYENGRCKHRIEKDNDWGVEGEHTHKSQTPRLSGGDKRQAGVDQCERPVRGPPKAR